MTSVLFVHGTGGRTPYLAEPFRRIKQALQDRRSDLRVERCRWGDSVGARLGSDGKSIPTYDTARGEDAVDQIDADLALWSALYNDPFYELRLLSLRPTSKKGFELGVVPPGDEFRGKVRSFQPSAGLTEQIRASGLADFFEPARHVVADARPFREAMNGAGDPFGPYVTATARSIVATAIALSEQAEVGATAATSAAARDSLVESLRTELGDSERSFLGVISAPVRGVASSIATMYATRKRGAITDAASPFVADIILYQTRGTAMRSFVRSCIATLEPPIVVIAHSLGGIMSVDLLATESIPTVKLLVTVGSQAPYLYEINALSSLEHGAPLPDSVPAWLNIYDLRDMLSYQASTIFPGRVDDVRVDNGQPFPRSHSAYWDNPETWDVIVPRLP